MSLAGIERRLRLLEQQYRSRFLCKVTFVLEDGSRVTVRGEDTDPRLYFDSGGNPDAKTAARIELLRRSVAIIPFDELLELARALALSPAEPPLQKLTSNSESLA